VNVITVMIDSLRPDHIGLNGKKKMFTPHLDEFGKQSVRFNNAYPESLATIPVRKALWNGKRDFPFWDWKPWRQAQVPGWNPLPEKPDTIAEILKDEGWTTALLTDTYHLFKPDMNFHRGFKEYRWFRGQEHDFYRTGKGKVEEIAKYATPKMHYNDFFSEVFGNYLKNTQDRQNEEDWSVAKLFKYASCWLEDNYKNENPFYLVIDSFCPHEPFDPPRYYSDMYDPGYEGTEVILPHYSEDLDYLSEKELNHTRALYAGQVSLVDRWFGYFMETVKNLGLMDDTLIIVMSDHGHLLGERGFIGKPTTGLYPELLDIVYWFKMPGQEPKEIDSLVYNFDYFPTLFHLIGKEIPEQAEGENLWELVQGKKEGFRDYITCILKNFGVVFDGSWALIIDTKGNNGRLYDVTNDSNWTKNVADQRPEEVKRLFELLKKDGGGSLPDNLPVGGGPWLF
jgi:arylsulfatase A-like enzyme